MYNLLKFIIKYHFTFLYVFLLFIAAILVVNGNNYQKTKFLNAANFITGNVYAAKSNVSNYFKLKEINENLMAENAILKSQLKEVEYTLVPKLEIDSLCVPDTIFLDTIEKNDFVTGKVISNSLNKQFNVIFINKGLKDGFYQNMGIVSQHGVVGVIRNISENYATVTPVINRNFNINAKIKGSGYFGNLNWDGTNPNYAQLYDIPNHYEPTVGDTIITSGYSQIFNEGFIIGYIDTAHNVPGKSFLNIQVRLAVDFGNLNYIYGLENPIKTELDSLHFEEQH